ncbi:MAG: DUF1501 domain-containing protein [Rudaea sp.]|nr:DUF1501 domain-containing protein [Rudaea sp.]
MSHTRNSRRDFINKLCCLAASGGAAAMIPQLRMMGTALASSSTAKSFSDYKALVCVYLNGGNDSWNLLVPFDDTRFNTYTTARSGTYNANTNAGGLGLSLPAGATQIAAQVVTDGNDSNTSTQKYFLHPSLTSTGTTFPTGTPTLANLFTQGHLAFAVNVGTLIKPINMNDYISSSTNNPPQLFSHADQTAQWHQAYANESVTTGWGGLCAENLQGQGANLTSNPTVPLAISIAGANRYEVGSSTVPYQLSSNGLVSMSGVCNPTCTGVTSNSTRDQALQDLLAQTYLSDFAGQYSTVFNSGRGLYTKLSNNLPPLSTTYAPTNAFPANNSLAAQLKTVATMINLSKTQGYASRQIFFVQLGGFDLHSGFQSANSGHNALLSQVALALNAFWTAMGQFGTQSQVTAFTVSDFARTLQSNGAGSDHGWGSLQMVLGGAVNGGKLYNNGAGKISGFPNQAYGSASNPNTNAFSRGQLIPGVGVEQYAATLAQWMGITLMSDLNAIFPNLQNFSGFSSGNPLSTNLGFV